VTENDGTPHGRSLELPTAIIRGQLDRILTSHTLRRHRCCGALLQYLVEQTLNGQTELKEYAVGVEVFDRGSTFDPRSPKRRLRVWRRRGTPLSVPSPSIHPPRVTLRWVPCSP
jgi:hypothetical protein